MARFIPTIPKRLPHIHIPFFRIFYSTTYTVLYFITIVMLCINPAVMIYTAFDQGTYQYVFEIGGVYILTGILAIFIYLSRLYTNRTVMAAVGKSYIPVEDGEVAKKVRKMISRALERSTIIALESRPRDLSNSIDTVISNSTSTSNEKIVIHPSAGRVLKLDPHSPPWGRIQHPGWSTPSQTDSHLPPHVNFRTVIHELPNLVEAKAVSLAPPDPYATPKAAQPGEPVLADPVVVQLLRRRPCSDLRTYLAHLSMLGLINPMGAGEDFLWQYERARFSSIPLSEDQFGHLMESFAILLTDMQELSKTIIGEVRANVVATDASSISSISESSVSSSSRSASIAGSIRIMTPRHRDTTPSLYRSVTATSFDTAPTSAIRSRTPGAFSSRTANTADTPRPQTANTHFSSLGSTLRHPPSRESLASVGSVLHAKRTLSDDVSISSGSISSSLRSRSLRSYAGSVIRHSPVRARTGVTRKRGPPG